MPPPDRIVAFLIAIAIMELTPGPNMGYLAATSLSAGWRKALLFTLGAALAFAVALGLALLASATLNRYAHVGGHFLNAVGAAYFLWLAIDAWRQSTAAVAGDAGGPGSAWSFAARGFVANIVSPKTWIFYIVVVPAFAGPAASSGQLALYGGTHVVFSALVHVAIVSVARLAAPLFDGRPGRSGLLNRLFAVGLALLAGWLGLAALDLAP